MDLRPPRRIETARTVIRPWRPDDARAMHAAIVASTEHLRPWMPWIADEPQTVAQRRELIEEWVGQWERGVDFVYGIFDPDDVTVIGGTGLHPRVGPDALEIGYWVHVERSGQGLATEVAAALTTVALTLPGIHAVVIRHDRANAASGAVPRKLGYERHDAHFVTPAAPGEEGFHITWRCEVAPPAPPLSVTYS